MIARLIAEQVCGQSAAITLAKAVLRDDPTVNASARSDELSRRMPVKKGFGVPASTRSFPPDLVRHPVP